MNNYIHNHPYRLKDFIQFNPKEKLPKGAIARKITMEQLSPNNRYVESNIFEEYKGGSKFRNGDTIMARITPCLENGKTAYITSLNENELAFGSTEFIVFRKIEGKSNSKYIYYLLKTPQIRDIAIKSMVGSSGRQRVQQNVLENYEVLLPTLDKQIEIASILSSLDDKIELNRRINENLEQQAQALFKSWFVDFEPFKDGKFVDSELGMIPEGWKVVNLLNIAELYDSFRRPLSSRDRAPMEKLYPYYGATSVMDYVDNYIFDGIYLLMGEDGSVINEKGYPYLQYVFGKFWPNNHAHVMQGKNGFTTEMLHCFLLKKNISGIVTGAVQAKISQQSMKKILLAIPNENLCGEFACLIVPIYANIRNIINENRILSQLRNTLLPRLISGELEIKDKSYD